MLGGLTEAQIAVALAAALGAAFVRGLAGFGMAILLITHDLGVVRKFSQRVAVMQQGAIDVFPEYTGTGLLVILKAPLVSDAAELRELARRTLAVLTDVAREEAGEKDPHAQSDRDHRSEDPFHGPASSLLAVVGSSKAGEGGSAIW